MKNIIYYLFLLLFVALIGSFLIFNKPMTMGTMQMIEVSAALVVYTLLMSFVGEKFSHDERSISHRNMANRAGLIVGLCIFCVGIIFQLFQHKIDYWLLAGLVAINLTKIIDLAYLQNRN